MTAPLKVAVNKPVLLPADSQLKGIVQMSEEYLKT